MMVDGKMVTCERWEDFVPLLEEGNLILTPFCNETEWEEKVIL